MKVPQEIDDARSNDWLWPPIADALDTFAQTAYGGASAYERAWRLVHVWESVGIVLSSAAITRLEARQKDSSPDRDLWLKSREHWFGVYRGEGDSLELESRDTGALFGKFKKRIELLNGIAFHRGEAPGFIGALRSFLNYEGINQAPLVAGWAHVGAEPSPRERLTVREAMDLVNEFRNKLAHVPFPPDAMESVADGLLELTGQLFAVQPLPSKWQKGAPTSVLTGAVCAKRRLCRGARDENWASPSGVEEVHLQWPAKAGAEEPVEIWLGAPMFYVDNRLRVWVTSRRIRESDVAYEMTRFRAEHISIQIVEKPEWQRLMPPPRAEDYQQEGTGTAPVDGSPQQGDGVDEESTTTPKEAKPTSASSIEEARVLARLQDWEPVINFYEAEINRAVRPRDDWHLALGNARRELGVRVRFDDPDRAIKLFEAALEALTKAKQHTIDSQKAKAFYGASKVYYQRWRLQGSANGNDAAQAWHDANRAIELDYKQDYWSWLEYMERALPKGVTSTSTGA